MYVLYVCMYVCMYVFQYASFVKERCFIIMQHDLTRKTEERDSRRRKRDWGGRAMGKGGFEGILLCFSLTKKH
jgi:hypothetical protein